MKNVVVVAPYFGPNMTHCLGEFAALSDVRLGIITQEDEARIPEHIRPRIEKHWKVTDAGDASQLVAAGNAFKADWRRIDRMECYLEQLQVPVAEARDALDVDGMRAEAAHNFREKNRMKKVLAAHGLPVARQALVTNGDDARRFADQVGYPIVLKPLAGLGAKNTQRVIDETTLHSALNQLLPSAANPAQAEEFIRGDEHTFETVLIDGRPVWHSSTYYLPGPLEVIENAWMQYCLLLPRDQDLPHVHSFRDVNVRALQALGMRDGLSHMEWFLRGDGSPIVSEVGARPPGANIMPLLNAAHDSDPWRAWVRLVVDRRWEFPERRFSAGCAFLRGMGVGDTIKEVRGVEECMERLGDRVHSKKLPQIGQPHSTHYEGDGWVIVRAPDTDAVMDGLRTVITTIESHLG